MMRDGAAVCIMRYSEVHTFAGVFGMGDYDSKAPKNDLLNQNPIFGGSFAKEL